MPLDCIEVSLELVCAVAPELWSFIVPELVVLADEPWFVEALDGEEVVAEPSLLVIDDELWLPVWLEAEAD